MLIAKIGDHIAEGLFVDIAGMKKVKELTSVRKNRVIFMPIFKSFMDFIVLHYCNYFYDLPFGFTLGNKDDHHNVHAIDYLLKRTGLLLLNR